MLKNVKLNLLYDLELNNAIVVDLLIKKYYKSKINNNYNLFSTNVNKVNIFLDAFNNKVTLEKINFYVNILNEKNNSIRKSNILKKKIKKYKSILYYYKSLRLVKKINNYNLLYGINNYNIFNNKKIKMINLYKSFNRKLRKRHM